MEKILNLISAKMADAFEAAGFDRSYGRVTVSNRPTCANTSVTALLPPPKHITRRPFRLPRLWQSSCITRTLSLWLLRCPVLSICGCPALSCRPICLPCGMTRTSGWNRSLCQRPLWWITAALMWQAAAHWPPAFRHHRREHQADLQVFRQSHHRGRASGRLGLQMGLIIAGLQDRQPELCYFDGSFTGPYPEEAPFTMTELETIYPAASARSKEDPAFAQRAHEATFALQEGRPGYRALWKHIMAVFSGRHSKEL